jgi:hypothetical protein
VAKSGGEAAARTIDQVLTHASEASRIDRSGLDEMEAIAAALARHTFPDGPIPWQKTTKSSTFPEAVIPVRALEATIEELRQTVQRKDMELHATHDLLRRIERGRVMRLMNAAQAYLKR